MKIHFRVNKRPPLDCILSCYIHSAFEVFMAVKIKFVVFWFIAPCRVVVGYQPFGGPCCFHLQGWSVWSELESLYNWRSVGQSVSPSWRRAPFGIHDRF